MRAQVGRKRGELDEGLAETGKRAQDKSVMSSAIGTRRLRLMIVCGGAFIGVWHAALLHPVFGQFRQAATRGTGLYGSAHLVYQLHVVIDPGSIRHLGVLVATRLWPDTTAVKLVGYSTGFMCLAYSGYMLIKPWRVPFHVPTVVYVIGPALLALCFLVPASRR
jgi:hypothetical protein